MSFGRIWYIYIFIYIYIYIIYIYIYIFHCNGPLGCDCISIVAIWLAGLQRYHFDNKISRGPEYCNTKYIHNVRLPPYWNGQTVFSDQYVTSHICAEAHNDDCQFHWWVWALPGRDEIIKLMNVHADSKQKGPWFRIPSETFWHVWLCYKFVMNWV